MTVPVGEALHCSGCVLREVLGFQHLSSMGACGWILAVARASKSEPFVAPDRSVRSEAVGTLLMWPKNKYSWSRFFILVLSASGIPRVHSVFEYSFADGGTKLANQKFRQFHGADHY